VAGLSKELLADLRETLLSCGPFYNGKAVQALFVDERLRPWRNHLPDADSSAGRVDAVISYLINRRNRQGESALWLLTQLLQDRADPEDACHDQLAVIGGRLQSELNRPAPAKAPMSPAPQQPAPPDRPINLVRLHKLLTEHFDLEDLRTLCFALSLDIDNLNGHGPQGKARELALYMQRRGRVAELMAQLKQERPFVDWDIVYES
jgi:hypothetical protein